MKLLRLFYIVICCLSFVYTASIQDMIDSALNHSLSKVVIPPGIYREAVKSNGVHLSISNAKNFSIFAYSVVMVCTSRSRAISIDHSVNVSIYGLTVDYDPLTFTQGDIIDMGDGYIDVQIHIGYPVVAWDRVNIKDRNTRFFKDGVGFLWDTTAQIIKPGLIRVFRNVSEGGFYNTQVGDFATLVGGSDSGYICHAISVWFCSGTILQDLSLYAAPGFGLEEFGGEGATILYNVGIVPGPKPPAGAVQPRLQSSSWDAIQHQSVKKGPRIINCRFVLAGDDTWSAIGDNWQIENTETDSSGNTIQLSGDSTGIFVGDELRFRNRIDFPNEYVKVKQITNIRDGKQKEENTLKSLYAARCACLDAKDKSYTSMSTSFKVLVDRAIPSNWNSNSVLFSPDRQTSGFTFHNNYVHSKGRGCLVKTTDGTITDNIFEGGVSAVEIGSEISGDYGSDAGLAYNIVIRGNTIIHTGYHETFNVSYYGPDGAIAIFAYVSSTQIRNEGAIKQILIQSNRFDSVNGINIGVTSSNSVNITGNDFANTHSVPTGVVGGNFGFDNGYVIYITESNSISLSGNEVLGEGKYKKGNLFVTNSVVNIKGKDNGVIQS